MKVLILKYLLKVLHSSFQHIDGLALANNPVTLSAGESEYT